VFALAVCASQISGTITYPGYATILKEIYPDDKRATIMGYIRIGLAFASFVFTLLVGWLLKIVDFQYLFPVAGLIGAASALAFGSIRMSPVDDDAAKPTMSEFVRCTLGLLNEDRRFLWFMLVTFLFGFANVMAITVYPVFQVDELRITATQVAVLANATTLVWMFSFPYWGRYVDVRSPVKALAITIAITTLVPLNYFFATNGWMLLPGALLYGTVLAAVELSYFNAVMCFTSDGRESHYQSLHSFATGIRGIIAPFVAMALYSVFKHSGVPVRFVFLIIMAMMLMGAGIQAVQLRYMKSMQGSGTI
jgi:MFS family permease